VLAGEQSLSWGGPLARRSAAGSAARRLAAQWP